jgi:hypothetical protein
MSVWFGNIGLWFETGRIGLKANARKTRWLKPAKRVFTVAGRYFMKRGSLTIVLMLSFLGLRLLAQEATEEAPQGWPIVERCVGEPISPPDDWSFEGTILATGWAGIHGINAEWDTPFVIAFNNYSYMPYSISPNGNWIAQVEASTAVDDSYWNGRRVTIGNIVVSNTYNRAERYLSDRLSTVYTVGVLHVFPNAIRLPWWDEDTLVIAVGYDAETESNYVLGWSFQTNEYIELDVRPSYGMTGMGAYISPDWSRMVSTNPEYLSLEGLIDLQSDVPTISLAFEDLWRMRNVHWLPDSSAFALGYHNWLDDIRLYEASIQLYDRDGKFIDTIAVERAEDVYLLAFDSSPNSEFLVFQNIPRDSGTSSFNSLKIADMRNHEILDTCIIPSSFAWSANSNQIAVMGFGEEHSSPLILDLADWRLYKTGIYHEGDILFWRAD